MTIAFNYLGKLGQLGNQMFQYAATLGVARYTGVTFTIPNHDEVLVDGLGNKLKIELFDCFDIKPDNTGLLKTDYVVQEKGFEFNRDILHSSRTTDYTLYGFFQTERYFKHCAKEIRKNFTFKKQIVDECREIIDSCFEEPIALHIRRGDFLINSGNHFNQTLDYYEKALAEFPDDVPVVVFSDHIEWCKEQEFFAPDRFIMSESTEEFSDGQRLPWTDLCLMSLCTDAIIANSSFSWWGAWLQTNPYQQVIAPKKWFGPQYDNYHMDDLIPEGWKVV